MLRRQKNGGETDQENSDTDDTTGHEHGDVAEPGGNCGGQNDPCPQGSPANPVITSNFQKNVKCEAVWMAAKTYKFRISVELEYPYSQPGAVVLDLVSYNGNIRKRGTCSNLLSDDGSAWEDTNGLWNPNRITNTANWTLTSTLSSGPSVKKRWSTKWYLLRKTCCIVKIRKEI